jgi:DNA-binding MarR family transcriptional regulator
MAKTKHDADRPALASALAAMEIFQQRLMARHATEFTTLDVTMPQAKLLYVVATAGELSMSEIAARLGVTVSTSSGAVERLVELGLLARSDDPNNRRQVRVSVTDRGSATLGQLRELSSRPLRTLLERVSDEDLDTIERAIRIMADALSDDLPPTIDSRSDPVGSPTTNPDESRGS